MSTNVYENPPRHTAKQVADDVAAGMDPDVELVPTQYYDQMKADRDSETRWACQYKAERDEVQGRLDAVVASLKPGPEPDRQLTNIPNHTDSDLIWSEWHRQSGLHARAVAIAEGRTP